ncbi:MAG: hydrogenase expression/formation protein HypE [Actinobacteria bacterium]|nr:hydrogenase expression/formation protein HypE [Actinomycetota bacterium]
MTEKLITMAHGGGGTRMLDLLDEIVFPILGEGSSDTAEDAALLDLPAGRVAVTTDSFVVRPLFFPGGDIGKLSVCGTVNDLAMMGADPVSLTIGLILEEGLPFETLKKVLESMSRTAADAGVRIVAGDTKVVEKGHADGLYINSSGLGVISEDIGISIANAEEGDVLIINGYIGDHGIAVMTKRQGFNFEIDLQSDCAPLSGLVKVMIESGTVHTLRDPTRGGLGAVLKEMAKASSCTVEINEQQLPVRESVRSVCEVLGLDPVFVANEGKLLCAAPESDAEDVLRAMRNHPLGQDAVVIGRVIDGRKGDVQVITPIGSRRLLRMPSGEELPRIC